MNCGCIGNSGCAGVHCLDSQAPLRLDLLVSSRTKGMASVLSFALVLVARLLLVVWQVRHHGCRGVTDAWVARQASMNRCAGACLLCEACFVEMCRVA